VVECLTILVFYHAQVQTRRLADQFEGLNSPIVQSVEELRRW